MTSPIGTKQLGNLLIFSVEGELSSFLLDTLKHEIVQKVREEKITRIIVNLDKVDYLMSKDLGAFVQIFRFLISEVDSGNGTEAVLAFCCVDEFVDEVFKMTKLDTVFKVYATENDAVEALSRN